MTRFFKPARNGYELVIGYDICSVDRECRKERQMCTNPIPRTPQTPHSNWRRGNFVVFSEVMSSQDQWIDTVMIPREGPSQICDFCAYLFTAKLNYQLEGVENVMGRTSEGLKPTQSVEDFRKSVSPGNTYLEHLLDLNRTGE